MTRDPADEEAAIAEIVRGFLASQARAAAEEGRALRRGTHAKGVCARGVFEVLDVTRGRDPRLAARLARGLYARPGRYPATLRFASSDPSVDSDWTPDVRGMSLAVELPHGTFGVPRQDLSMQSAPTLPFNDVRAFLVYARVLAAPNETVALGSLPFPDQLEYARTKGAVARQKRQPVRPYQQLRYWSNVPFRHGAEDVVKYSAVPSPANPARPLDRRDRSALQDELRRHVTEDAVMSAWDFGLQLLDVDAMTHEGRRRDAAFWIENASVEWPEAQAPFHTVARITLAPRSLPGADACEALFIDVNGHTTAEGAPVGAVNRARWHAERASRDARAGIARGHA